MRKFLCLFLVFLIAVVPFTSFATQNNEFVAAQAAALYSATEDGNTINIAQDGVTVSGRNVTVKFSSDKLVSGSSELIFIAYKPQDDNGEPTKDNICYVNQITYSNGSFTFPVSSAAPVGFYVLLIGGSDFDAVARVAFPIGIEANFVLGDVNSDSVFNTLDVIKLKNYLAEVEEVTSLWTAREDFVADFNEDGNADLLDVLAMKESIANRTLNE